MIPIPRDFRQFIALLNAWRVRYLFNCVGLPYLLQNKLAAGRDKDRLDVKNLPDRPRRRQRK